uniref:Uncharacterized protein n=1 Tax=Phytophthora ramorum TaxID=164328 RepID=H3H8K4_PHYRM
MLLANAYVYFNKLLRNMITHCMMPASYFSLGEAVPPSSTTSDWQYRSTLTSRHLSDADVVVHRLLAAAIGVASPPDNPYPTRTDAVISNVMNNGVRVLLPDFDIQSMIFLCDKDVVQFDGNRKLQVLDRVRVKVYVALTFGNRQEIKMELLDEDEGDNQNHEAQKKAIDRLRAARKKCKYNLKAITGAVAKPTGCIRPFLKIDGEFLA